MTIYKNKYDIPAGVTTTLPTRVKITAQGLEVAVKRWEITNKQRGDDVKLSANGHEITIAPQTSRKAVYLTAVVKNGTSIHKFHIVSQPAALRPAPATQDGLCRLPEYDLNPAEAASLDATTRMATRVVQGMIDIARSFGIRFLALEAALRGGLEAVKDVPDNPDDETEVK